MIRPVTRNKVLILLGALLLPASAVVATTATAATAAASTTINIDGTQSGRTFDGIGAISGGGGNSRLLTDYPAAQQSQILDYLFKPNYGASLQILKVEIGGDANSTDGSEPSIEHTQGTVECNTGYEWWLMEQAKARNPGIKLYGLAWGAPGWIGSDFWTQNSINYLISWLGCAKSHGLTIDYLGGWNERGYNVSWYENLHSTLAADGYGNIKVVGADSGWDVADAMVGDPAFANSVDIVGAHYPCNGGDGGDASTCSTTANATATGKQLWASENGSQDENSGAEPLIRSIVRGYTDARMTAYINWPLIAAIYPNLGYDTTGLMVANQPWSGNYSVGANLWATAQVTQFTQPGWHFIDSASGYLGGSESNGTYATLKSTNGSDYTTVLETTTATAAQTANFSVGGGLSTGTVHVWSTDLASNDQSTYFVHSQDVTPSGGKFSLTLQPGYVYTISTTSGQAKGTATSPAPAQLGLPYSDNFDGYATQGEARLLADQNGSFEIRPCGGGRGGQCVRQMAAQEPVNWDGASNPYTILGSLGWADYTVSSDVLLEQPGAVQLLGRVGTQQPFAVAGINEYYLQVSNTGAWSIVKNTTSASLTTLASGTTTALGTGAWHHLALTFNGSSISAAVDGTTVGSANDSSYSQGQVGYGVDGYQTDEFDNLSVTPVGSNPVVSTYELMNRNSGMAMDVSGGSTADGGQVIQWPFHNGTNQQWTLHPNSNGSYTLVNVNSGKVLDVPNQSTTQGAALEQWTANGGTNQQWRLTDLGNGYDTLTGAGSGMLADVQGASTTQGTPVIQWPSNGGNNQEWKLVFLY